MKPLYAYLRWLPRPVKEVLRVFSPAYFWFRYFLARWRSRVAKRRMSGQQRNVNQRPTPSGRNLIRRHRPALRYIDLAAECFEHADDLAADVIVGHGVEALPAASLLAQATGARVVCDAIEIPSFGARAVPVTWHASNLDFLNHAFERYLMRCDGITTVGWTLGRHLESYGPPVHVVPNYRRAGRLAPSNWLRDRCGLKDTDRLLLSLSTITWGMADILHALKDLPDDVHLAHMGRVVPRDYEETIRGTVSELGLSDRVHFLDPVPYDQLTATASGADVGLIVLNPAVENHYVSLPNRLFDFLASGLPVCAPPIPDIGNVLESWKAGMTARDTSPRAWADAIGRLLNDTPRYRKNALEAADTLTWESIENDLPRILGHPDSVTFVGARNLHNNNRTLRIARSLTAQGVHVRIATVSDETPPSDPDIEFRFLTFDQRG